MSTMYQTREAYDQVRDRRISLRAPPAPNPCPVMTIPPGRAADWHQGMRAWEALPPPRHLLSDGCLPQPPWEINLHPDYGTLPGAPLLEALHGIGIVNGHVPIYTERVVRINIYWPQAGNKGDYEEWFDSPDMACAPLANVACIIAELYRGFFERIGRTVQAANPRWQIRQRDSAPGICFGQLRLTRLYSYDGVHIYPEIVAVHHR
ncbi:hypothetical protein BC834DRAFT_972947 [Gloeopeniophorella convolvens]|nr:hypothetical protein BC834DRAFT_972947 [Gloeopeniophorella convolvens]